MKKAHKHFSWNPIHPRHDWGRLLIIFTFCVVLVIAWSTYLFFSSGAVVSTDTVPSESEDSTTKQLERISSFFEKR